MEFKPSDLDPCPFIRHDCIIIIYIDDAILMACDEAYLQKVLDELKSHNYNFNRDGDF